MEKMTQMFQSLKQYDIVYHRGVHSPTTQDFAVEVVAVILPPTGNDFAFSKNNVDMTGRLAAGALDDFGAFVRSFVSTVPYDHATFVTGYDLVLGDADLLGYSYADTMCKQSSFSSGYHTSVIEFTSTISRTWAHELGHGLGMLHDQDVGCGDQTYIMSAGSISQLSDTAAYSKTFSACSYLSLQRYTNRTTTTNNNINNYHTDFNINSNNSVSTNNYNSNCDNSNINTNNYNSNCDNSNINTNNYNSKCDNSNFNTNNYNSNCDNSNISTNNYNSN
ncbi:probable serine/threonine-protein kinase ifkA [Dreissena polymorpha]|uniref:probable serine/threonine-protein kinase ifkA n=1 Tax=Dreissena polymorpha TaxID=45954 RepID=UPI002264EAD2|nr:probable serine/threonine-protein kinase ifkA [Dreissena polymorpha]